MSKKQSMYYLICDPRAGTVVRKSHTVAALSEMHLVSIRVPKDTWKSYRAGDMVLALELPDAGRDRWLRLRKLANQIAEQEKQSQSDFEHGDKHSMRPAPRRV